jgi:hypothetical protein
MAAVSVASSGAVSNKNVDAGDAKLRQLVMRSLSTEGA